jgi:CelD/BcsL family acetyltransferase involved in cellulose biosynthesis
MKTEIIDTSEQFMALRCEWDALLRRSVSDSVFLTHEWLSSWWKHLAEDRNLSILTAREGNELIGVLPLASRRARLTRMMPRCLELLGSGVIGSDYLDAIVTGGREVEVMDAFASRLDDRATMLQLSQLRGQDHLLSRLAQRLHSNNWAVDEAKVNVCPFIDLRGHTWETYVGSLGPHVRKGIKRCLRNLPRNFEYRTECVETPVDAQRALDVIIRLHKKRWTGGRHSEAFHSEPVNAFHREFVDLAASRGWLRLLIVYLNDQPAGALYGLRYGPTFYFYQSGFDPAFSKHSVGVATMAVAIQRAIEEGVLEYDFLHGDEEYKFHWAREARNLMRIELHPPRARAWIYKQAMDCNRAARQMAKRVLDRASNVALTR